MIIRIVFTCSLFLYVDLFAQEVLDPVYVASSGVEGSTLAIPRWKGYMSMSNPEDFWLCYAQSAGQHTNINYTTDGGDSWSSNLFYVGYDGTLDFHTSMFGDSGGLYFTWPSGWNIDFRKIDYPAHDSSSRQPIRYVPGGTGSHRSNVMVQDDGRVWVLGGMPQ